MIKQYTNIQTRAEKLATAFKIGIGMFFISISPALFSQNIGINTAGTPPSINAILDLNTGTSNNLGLIVPNVSLTALGTFKPPIANAATAADVGMMVYNTNSSVGNGVGYYYWNGSAWMSVASSGGGGNVNPCGGALANYIPYFTSSSTVCNSVIYQASTTKVGVGTITPQNMLDVSGAVAVGAYAGANTAPAGTSLIASGQVGIGTNTPNASAIMDLTSSNMGMLTPRLSSAQIAAMTNFAVGLVVYNTTTNCFEYNTNGTAGGWTSLACACSDVPQTPGPITPVNVCFGVSNLTVSIPIDFGATYYTWTVPAMVGSWSGQGTNSITVNSFSSTGTGNFTVTASNACGNSATATQSFTVFTGNPTGSLSSATTICSTSGSAVTITGLGNYATVTWSAPTTICSPAVIATANLANATSLTLSGGTGGTGVVTATISNPCGSINTSTSTITCYSGNPTGALLPATSECCSTGTDLVSIFGLGNYATIVWSAPASVCSAAVVTAANAANATSLTLSGGTGGLGTISATITNSCGSITTTTSVRCFNGAPTGTLTPASLSFCTPSTPSDAITLTGLGTTDSTIVWSVTGGTNICSAAVIAAANAANSGKGATSLTLSGGTGGTGTVSATLTNSCGSTVLTSSTITYTVPNITLDVSSQSGANTNSFSITTSSANELVLVSCNGDGILGASPVAVTGAATLTPALYQSLLSIGNYASIYVYWFVAPSAGTYNIAVTETGMTYYYNFAAALTGFCTTPSATDFISFTSSPLFCATGCTSDGAALTETAGSYAFGAFADNYYTGFSGVTWTNLTNLQYTAPGLGVDDCAIGGQTVGAAGTPTITATDNNIYAAALLLINIQ